MERAPLLAGPKTDATGTNFQTPHSKYAFFWPRGGVVIFVAKEETFYRFRI